MTMEDAEKFHHPFQPYDIQLQFMRALYDCIEEGKIGIFESPTGTGKSLSLACGSLTWLRDHKKKEFDESIAALEADDDEPEWMIQHSREEKKNQVVQKRADLEARLEKIRRQECNVRERQANGPPRSKKRKLEDLTSQDTADEDQFVLNDYESDDGSSGNTRQGDSDLGLSKETQALMEKIGYPLSAPAKEDGAEPEDELKIYFCSRTHSQLTQFVNELRRVRLPPAITIQDEMVKPETKEDKLHEELKHLSLGSRKNLCINTKVSSLKNPTAVNERCLELQDSKTSADRKCPFVPNKENEASVLDFQHHALAKIRDIEDLGTLGKKLGICPYYATRPAVKPSEIVTLPYPLLLQKSAREALGLSLKNHIVIIDEAHNLMDAISSIYTVEVSLAQLQRAREQLTIYLQKFRNRLKGKNRVYVTQVVRLLDSLMAFLNSVAGDKKVATGTVQSTDLLRGKGVDQINLHKLMAYLQESKLARKVEGYVSLEKQKQQEKEKVKVGKSNEQNRDLSVPVLTHVQSLFNVLTNPAREGRLFYTLGNEKPDTKLKYMLLDPSENFREIVEDARAVILAGGTMSPMDDYLQQLFPYIDSSKITTLSCGHVIPPSNLFVSPVVQSCTGSEFDFTFSSRNSPATLNSLGETIIRVISKVPDGVVIFFPSYAYLNQVILHWQKRPANGDPSIWFRMEMAKPIFKESQMDSNSAESALNAYTGVVTTTSPRGAMLLAVIGGKLSEGINFSDKLGRCVMVVGLPYPNPYSPEWKAKTEYIERKAVEKGQVGSTGSREFAENVCMRAVNQAIGRAVRHRGDWAAILLLDKRYAQKRIEEKLPSWIRASLPKSTGGGFSGVESGLVEFFAEKKAKGM